MRVFRRTVHVLIAVSALGCRDTTGPRARSAQFVLHDIDGRVLPTFPAATPGLTPTILGGTVVLDKTGHVVITEHRTEWDGTDRTSSVLYAYEIDGARITFRMDPPCGPTANCVAPPTGTIFLGHLALEFAWYGGPIVFHYDPA